MKEIPRGFLDGLKNTVAYARCGDNWRKLLAHMSRLANETGAPFKESLLHAMLADDEAEEIHDVRVSGCNFTSDRLEAAKPLA